MLEYRPNPADLAVHDFETSDIVMAASTFFSNTQQFPGVPEETVTNPVIREGGVTLTEKMVIVFSRNRL